MFRRLLTALLLSGAAISFSQPVTYTPAGDAVAYAWFNASSPNLDTLIARYNFGNSTPYKMPVTWFNNNVEYSIKCL